MKVREVMKVLFLLSGVVFLHPSYLSNGKVDIRRPGGVEKQFCKIFVKFTVQI